MRRLLLVTPLLVIVAACTTGTSDYKSQTENFINRDTNLETDLAGDISNAECEKPDSTEIGTTYTCTAQVEGTGVVDFDALIDREDGYTVTYSAADPAPVSEPDS